MDRGDFRGKWVKGSVSLVRDSGPPRPQGARDDKGVVGAYCLSLRGRQNGRRGNPSCLGGRGWKLRFVTFPPFTFHSSIFTLPFIGPQWIAAGFRPRDDKGITFRLLAQAHNESNGLVYLLHRFGINLSHKFSDSGNRDCLNLVHHQLGFFSKPVRLAWLEVESEQRCLD